jgi:hypothetical protein
VPVAVDDELLDSWRGIRRRIHAGMIVSDTLSRKAA